MKDSAGKNEVIIVAATPQFLERGDLWFSENQASIKTALQEQKGIWARSAFLVTEGETVKPSSLLRTLHDLRYEKVQTVLGKGEFSAYGNIIEIGPINMPEKIVIEFYGNMIDAITVRPYDKVIQKKIKGHQPFSPGDYVVHLDHGIGIFRRMTMMPESREEFFEVEYAAPREGAKHDTLYVPVSQRKKLDLYVGFETPSIHRLGGTVWFNTKSKAREDIEAFAKELLALYAKRAQIRRRPMCAEPELEKKFSESFPYELTPDQERAIHDILSDLEKTVPMDRVLAGDVGFGKTEVAFRAALRTIMNGQQVLLLSPTTILAEEHTRAARERFAGLPIRIETLSRLTPERDARKIVHDFQNGKIDLLIGTHRILSHDVVQYLNTAAHEDATCKVGLLIIDEEQRFGVKQKETFKNARAEINILSMSATPIPRTLFLSLANLRSISTIQTPPKGRIPVQTFVLPYRADLVRDAIERELSRHGQVFFLHNRVETLELFRKKIQKMVPRARIGIIHGRTKAADLVRTLSEFRHKRIDVLVATTIIENGIDFPNANTLIVEDATRLGLSESHQLRGRIGRSDRESFAYFLYRSRSITDEARRRLDALQDASGPGAGYDLALRDLEIRGAGNVLGRDQSGTAYKIGLNLYYTMLAEAIEHGKAEHADS